MVALSELNDIASEEDGNEKKVYSALLFQSSFLIDSYGTEAACAIKKTKPSGYCQRNTYVDRYGEECERINKHAKRDNIA